MTDSRTLQAILKTKKQRPFFLYCRNMQASLGKSIIRVTKNSC